MSNNKAKLQIGSNLFYIVWISSIILLLISIIYLVFCPYSFQTVYPIYIFLLILIGILMLPFAGKFNIGKLFSIELKELSSSIEKLRDTIINIGIKNVQEVKVTTAINGPYGESFKVYALEQSQKNLNLANSLFQQQRFMESLKYYHEALKYDNDNWVAAMYLGFIYLSLPEFGVDENEWGFNNDERLFRSIFYSAYAAEKDVNHYNQFMNLAIAQKHLGGEGLTRLAIKNMEKAYNMLNYDPNVINNPKMFLNKGKAISFMGEFEEALGNKDKAIQYRKEAIEIFNQCPKPNPPDLEKWKNQAQEALNKLENK